jgi:hypothetical protein
MHGDADLDLECDLVLRNEPKVFLEIPKQCTRKHCVFFMRRRKYVANVGWWWLVRGCVGKKEKRKKK